MLVAPAVAVDSWTLSDEDGQSFQASVFEQPFPEYSSGWLLRLNALGAGSELDHDDARQVSDAMGQGWTLANRSEEIVPPDGTPIPAKPWPCTTWPDPDPVPGADRLAGVALEAGIQGARLTVIILSTDSGRFRETGQAFMRLSRKSISLRSSAAPGFS